MNASLRSKYTHAQFNRIPTDVTYKGRTLGIDAEYLNNGEPSVRLPVKEKDRDGYFKGGTSTIAKQVDVGEVGVYRATASGQRKFATIADGSLGSVGDAMIRAIVSAGEQSPLAIVALVSAENLAETAIRAGFTPISD